MLRKRHENISFSVIATVNCFPICFLHVFPAFRLRRPSFLLEILFSLSRRAERNGCHFASLYVSARPSASAERSSLPAISLSPHRSRFLYSFHLPPRSVRTLPLIHTDRHRRQEDLGQRSLRLCFTVCGRKSGGHCEDKAVRMSVGLLSPVMSPTFYVGFWAGSKRTIRIRPGEHTRHGSFSASRSISIPMPKKARTLRRCLRSCHTVGPPFPAKRISH